MKSRVLFGAFYTVVYFFLAIWNVGPEGKGTSLFLYEINPYIVLTV